MTVKARESAAAFVPHVALGATAAQALLGPSFRITQEHGKVRQAPWRPPIVATMHPSAILRPQTGEERHRQMEMLVAVAAQIYFARLDFSRRSARIFR